MAYSNSALVNYTKISPNKTTTNRKPIDRITIHHMAGNCGIEACGDMFARSSQRSSSNYGIGTDGRIALYVEEKHSSWCSSSTANDCRAVTIEVANSSNKDPNWPVSDKALDATIRLCADICKRNGKNKAVYFPTLAQANDYKLKSNEMLFTRHDFFRNKNCPGGYLSGKMNYIIDQVNKILSGQSININTSTSSTVTKPTTSSLKLPYLIKVKANGLNIRSGPGTSNSIMGCIKDKGVYTIVNEAIVNNKTPWGELKLGGWICIDDEYVDKLRSIEPETPNTEVDCGTGVGIDEIVWNYLYKKGLQDYVIAGIMGNLYAESGLNSINLQGVYENKLNMTDQQYTDGVDNKSYANFINDSAGYGIAQWTYSTRKSGLLNLAILQKKSVGDLNLQLDYLWWELNNTFKSVLNELELSRSIEEATNIFLTKFEAPSNPEQHKATRLNYANGYFNKFGVNKVPYLVRITANILNIRDHSSLSGNVIGQIVDRGVYTIVTQRDNIDGHNWGELKAGGWIALDWIQKL